MDKRRHAIDLLRLREGETVLDVACGTGLSFPLLAERVGPSGRVIGVEVSPDMAALARNRIDELRGAAITLIEAAMEEATIPGRLDAILFHYTHDVLQSPAALANIFRAARPGARVAVVGSKYFPWWLAPANLYVIVKNRPYMANPAGLQRPWRYLERYVPRLALESIYLGSGYIAWGEFRQI